MLCVNYTSIKKKDKMKTKTASKTDEKRRENKRPMLGMKRCISIKIQKKPKIGKDVIF